MPRVFAATATAVVAATAIVAGQARPAARHTVVPITAPDARRPAEISVAIDPVFPDHAIAVSLQGGRPGTARVTNLAYVSEDGGLTWKTVPAANPEGRTQGDDAVAFGADGTAYHAYISFDGIRVERPARASSGIFVQRSRDGLTWSDPVPVVDHVNTAIPFEDKPWVTADGQPDSPHRGNVYVAWTRFDVYGSTDPHDRSHIWLARSRDGGATFLPPVRVSDDPGDARDSDNTVEGVVPSIGVKGEVFVAWAGPKGLVFDRSFDGGWSFGQDAVIEQQPGGWDQPLPGIERHNGMPVTAVDHSRGSFRGSLYVNWIDARNGDPDVFVIASRDGGATWERPVRVNDDPKGAAQLFTWMAVDPVDGSINVVFHDRRGLAGTETGVTMARSVDGGRTFVNYRVDTPPFAMTDALFFGDYNGIAASGGRVIAAFPRIDPGPNTRLMAAVFRFKPGTQETP